MDRQDMHVLLCDDTVDTLTSIVRRSRTAASRVAVIETIILEFADVAMKYNRDEWDEFAERISKVHWDRTHGVR